MLPFFFLKDGNKKRGFWIGIAIFLLILLLPAPSGLNETAWTVAAIAMLMVCWWATEAIPIPVTSLIPLALFPLLDVTDIQSMPQILMLIKIFIYFLVVF